MTIVFGERPPPPDLAAEVDAASLAVSFAPVFAPDDAGVALADDARAAVVVEAEPVARRRNAANSVARDA